MIRKCVITSAPRRETDFKKCRDDLGRPFFADLNFDGFRGLQNECRQRKKVASRGKIR
jgi:hypothetical protein